MDEHGRPHLATVQAAVDARHRAIIRSVAVVAIVATIVLTSRYALSAALAVGAYAGIWCHDRIRG